MAEATNYANLQQARAAEAGAQNEPAPTASVGAATRMSAVTATLLILVALGIDGVQAFLNFIIIGIVVNWIVSIVAWFIFYMWLKNLGISMNEAGGARVLISLGAAFGLELLPLINFLPGWTAFAILTVIFEFAFKK